MTAEGDNIVAAHRIDIVQRTDIEGIALSSAVNPFPCVIGVSRRLNRVAGGAVARMILQPIRVDPAEHRAIREFERLDLLAHIGQAHLTRGPVLGPEHAQRDPFRRIDRTALGVIVGCEGEILEIEIGKDEPIRLAGCGGLCRAREIDAAAIHRGAIAIGIVPALTVDILEAALTAEGDNIVTAHRIDIVQRTDIEGIALSSAVNPFPCVIGVSRRLNRVAGGAVARMILQPIRVDPAEHRAIRELERLNMLSVVRQAQLTGDAINLPVQIDDYPIGIVCAGIVAGDRGQIA